MWSATFFDIIWRSKNVELRRIMSNIVKFSKKVEYCQKVQNIVEKCRILSNNVKLCRIMSILSKNIAVQSGGTYESTFYRWTAAFYGMKLSRRVKKLLSFVGRPSDNFSIEIYGRNLVKIWSFLSIVCLLTLHAHIHLHALHTNLLK